MFKKILILSCSLFITISAYAKQKDLQPILQEFTKYARHSQKDWRVPGMAIAIVQDNKIIYTRGFGIRNSKGDPATPQTVFGIGSLTKSFTAALLARLIEQRKFSWNSKVYKLYPQFKLYSPGATKEFAIKDLLAHHSGLPEHTLDAQAYLGYDPDYIIYSLRFIKPIGHFGTDYAYQNCLLLVAQRIVEKYSGKSFAQYLRTQLFIPLHMQDSSVNVGVFNKQKNIAQPFQYHAGKVIAIPENWPYFYWERTYLPAGGIKSNVIDMAKWLIMQMNDGKVNGRQLISAQNIKFMRSAQTIEKRSSRGKIISAYGEGWDSNYKRYAPYIVFYHNGEVTGMSATMGYIPKAHIGFVILTNLGNGSCNEALMVKFFDMYFGKPAIDWSKKIYRERQENDAQIIAKLPKCKQCAIKNLSQYSGVYYNQVYGKVLVKVAKNHLAIIIGPKKIVWDLIPCRYDIFKLSWPDAIGIYGIEPTSGMVKFIRSAKNNTIIKMQIDFLNRDGSGVLSKR